MGAKDSQGSNSQESCPGTFSLARLPTASDEKIGTQWRGIPGAVGVCIDSRMFHKSGLSPPVVAAERRVVKAAGKRGHVDFPTQRAD